MYVQVGQARQMTEQRRGIVIWKEGRCHSRLRRRPKETHGGYRCNKDI